MNVIQCDTAVIIRRDATQVSMLLLSDNTLPRVSPERHFWQTCAPVNNAIAQTFGLSVITIRPLLTRFKKIDDESGEFHAVYLMRYIDGDLPPNAKWVNVDDLPTLATESAISREQIQMMLAEELTPRWYAYDWLEQLQETTRPIVY